METNTIVSNMGVLDIFFISVFLVGNIVLGIISRRKCWDVKEAVFGKESKFSNFTLLTSICATLLSATFFMNSIQKSCEGEDGGDGVEIRSRYRG